MEKRFSRDMAHDPSAKRETMTIVTWVTVTTETNAGLGRSSITAAMMLAEIIAGNICGSWR
ncbi:hypothetical protein [uncultured Paracoccus sp.]|uniref:hypothetical protein n=1 Tax=uncultured Paracoccus sp. TaxID=189685 RepID=UPI0025F08002|nr:hypothetical protein [uncultured Paracoccus sp.]